MRILFVSSGNTDFEKIPFIQSQEYSLAKIGANIDHFLLYGKGLVGYTRNIPRLKKYLKGNHFDIIHAHYSYCGWIAFLTGTKIPIVVSYMGSDVYGYVNNVGRRTPRSYLEILISKLLQPFVSKIIVKSKNLEDYIFLKDKAVIIPNGVDFSVFKPRNKLLARSKLNLSAENEIVLFLGNPKDPRKNFQLCENACSTINRKDLQVLTPYPVETEIVPYYLNACDVLVLSSYLEGSPNVIKEAMASNCPIVSTNVGDVEIVIGKTEGCFICSYEIHDVAAKINMAIDFGRQTNGRADIAHLNSDNIARKLLEVYQIVTSKDK